MWYKLILLSVALMALWGCSKNGHGTYHQPITLCSYLKHELTKTYPFQTATQLSGTRKAELVASYKHYKCGQE